jgi:hypothetical protein
MKSHLDDKAFKEATDELEEITVDFCENYGVSTDEFNGMMIAQVVRFYIHNNEFDQVKSLFADVLKSIKEIEQNERITMLDQFIKDQEEDDGDEQ